jgi:hypothetical protein
VNVAKGYGVILGRVIRKEGNEVVGEKVDFNAA